MAAFNITQPLSLLHVTDHEEGADEDDVANDLDSGEEHLDEADLKLVHRLIFSDFAKNDSYPK